MYEKRITSLQELVPHLQKMQARKIDTVVPSSLVKFDTGQLVIDGVEPVLTADGVTDANGLYMPTDLAVGQLANFVNVPVRYARRMLDERPDLFDANFNGWLNGSGFAPDERNLLYRFYAASDEGPAVLRSVHSQHYKSFDYLDSVHAVLSGLSQAGLTGGDLNITGSLSEKHMRLYVEAPEITANISDALVGYRDPTSGAQVGDVIRAGLSFSNSEVGQGAVRTCPYVVVLRCTNGWVQEQDAMRSIHAGTKLEEGIVDWSARTQQKNLELIESQIADAVGTFLSVGYVEKIAEWFNRQSHKEVEKPEEVIQMVSTELQYSEATRAGIMSMFIKGGQITALGVGQAMTALANQVEHPDLAHSLRADAFKAVELASA